MATETRIEARVTVVAEQRVKADVWFLTTHQDNFVVWYQIGHDGGEEPEYYETREEARERWREIASLAR